MNYRDLTEALNNTQPDVKEYLERALAYFHDQTTTSVKRLYLEVLEDHMGWVESIQYLKLLDDDDWQAVYEHAEGEKE